MSTDYSSWSSSDLVSRVLVLESQLREQNSRLSALLAASPSQNSSPSPPSASTEPDKVFKTKKVARPFDFSGHPTRYIALKFAYLGGDFNGFEHANGTLTPLPTIEEVLWKALRKARLIDPKPSAEDGEEIDTHYDVLWDTRDRRAKYGGGKLKLDISWEGCQYSKCGRTDRGVSAFGQVVGIRVRSKIRPQPTGEEGTDENTRIDADPEQHELAYASILNAILPPTIRILAVCLDPPADFDARFSCKERHYKYFFTNPAFVPTPGPAGLRGNIREGWLDIEKMQDAAKRLEGLHDFRNLCKVDPSKQNGSHDRRITFAGIERMKLPFAAFLQDPRLCSGQITSISTPSDVSEAAVPAEPQLYSFTVRGTAFLWHQVRCMVAILFLVGQGLERPAVVDHLLDINGKEDIGRPNYEMADDGPLVLWDCVFGEEGDKESLNWTYVGDAASLTGLTTRNDGKFGLGSLVDECWGMWRHAKIEEVLKGQLLGLVLEQGDGSALDRGGSKEPDGNVERSTKIFDGGDKGRTVGKYVDLKKRPKTDSVDVQRGEVRDRERGTTRVEEGPGEWARRE